MILNDTMSPCADCQRKHLTAALAYAACLPHDWQQWKRNLASPTFVGELSRAAVLLAESVHKEFADHAALALGFLVRAEDCAAFGCALPETAGKIREIRKLLALGGADEAEALGRLAAMAEPFGKDHYVDMFYGHLLEAQREGFNLLPGFVTPREYIGNFEGYIMAVGAEPAEAPQEKGGESEMGCKKCAAKAGKTAAKKAVKCACKGGKAKKGK